jgi:hypothetical protein
VFNIVSNTSVETVILRVNSQGIEIPDNWGDLPYPADFYIANLVLFFISMMITCFVVHWFEKNVDRLTDKYIVSVIKKIQARHKLVEERRRQKKKNVS